MSEPSWSASLAEMDVAYLSGAFRQGGSGFVQSLPWSAQAYLALALSHHFHRTLVWVVDSAKTCEQFHRDLLTLAGEAKNILLFPPRETHPGPAALQSDLAGDRLTALLRCLQDKEPLIIATCVQALLQKTPAPQDISRRHKKLALLQELDPDQLQTDLFEAGYVFEAEVLQKGQASRRGGLIDLWPPTEPWPLRLEFFGNVLDSIRTFDPVEQRSLDRLSTLDIAPAAEGGAGKADATTLTSDFSTYLPDATGWVWSEPDSLYHHTEMYRATMPEKDPTAASLRFDLLRSRMARQFSGGSLSIGLDSEQSSPAHELGLMPCEGLPALTAHPTHPDALDEMRRRFIRDVSNQASTGGQLFFYFNTEGGRDRFMELYAREFDANSSAQFIAKPLSEGFAYPSIRLNVITESDLYGIRKSLPGRYEQRSRKTAARDATGMRLAEWTDIQPGELVVHMDHGIGKYLGLYEILFDGQLQEVLAIEYADNAKLYVPVSQTHLLSRYVGVGRHRPNLHSLGGKRWTREKLAVEKAVRDLAGSLLETQARRSALEGHSFARDTPWQHEFESSFPFQETEDQHRAIRDTKLDMESKRPMDRLICGDVGYGKTEVAMRAAFKAVMDGKQVAV
ncbi:MAG: CarD family transcriptional regulator, partial [Lentisphaerota bacterium]